MKKINSSVCIEGKLFCTTWSLYQKLRSLIQPAGVLLEAEVRQFIQEATCPCPSWHCTQKTRATMQNNTFFLFYFITMYGCVLNCILPFSTLIAWGTNFDMDSVLPNSTLPFCTYQKWQQFLTTTPSLSFIFITANRQ